jgi:hypothetical protein
MTRPQQSREPAFQLMMAVIHGFSCVVHASALLYHLRRVQTEGARLTPSVQDVANDIARDL